MVHYFWPRVYGTPACLFYTRYTWKTQVITRGSMRTLYFLVLVTLYGGPAACISIRFDFSAVQRSGVRGQHFSDDGVHKKGLLSIIQVWGRPERSKWHLQNSNCNLPLPQVLTTARCVWYFRHRSAPDSKIVPNCPKHWLIKTDRMFNIQEWAKPQLTRWNKTTGILLHQQQSLLITAGDE